ncbi:hypothetical protein CGCA056_v009677 [Colletotrichum aenigma]|uniref:uncharacterized protein n=1 Tax=Colletotrichum aenigma TaxID=1215731 RepID=UPI001872D151|nr:uncharacterized protein CGCA056_v009677 [Colletotrichum aenigma]KAF5519195.1 hypothetical protein CGCA056_v009677 [Colletotrichum aenigma]
MQIETPFFQAQQPVVSTSSLPPSQHRQAKTVVQPLLDSSACFVPSLAILNALGRHQLGSPAPISPTHHDLNLTYPD